MFNINVKLKKKNKQYIDNLYNHGTPEDELINIVKFYFKNKNLLRIFTKLNNLPGFLFYSTKR